MDPEGRNGLCEGVPMTEVKPLSDETLRRVEFCLLETNHGELWVRLCKIIDALKSENARLREALRDVTDALNTYGPDFVHGEPKKMVVKRARAALAETEGK